MPENIKFRGVVIQSCDVRQSANGESAFTKIHLRADFSDPVREAMKWDARPEGWGGGDLLGELVGVEMLVKPSSRELARFAFKMPIKRVKDFKLVVLKAKGDGEEELVLTFLIETVAKGAYKTVGSWIENLGKEKAQLTVSYREGDQLEIGEAQATEEQRQAAVEIA